MRIFAKNYPEIEFVQEALAQIPWYHNIAIFEKIKEPIECEWYICKTVAHGWCQNLLVRQTPTEKLPKNIEALSWVHGISREAMRRAVGGRGMYLF